MWGLFGRWSGLILLAEFVAACGGSGPVEPEPGSIEVRISTDGPDIDPDGYSVSLDGSATRAAATNDTLVFSAVGHGDHTVSLSGLADNCAVGASNPRDVRVPAGSRVFVSFPVTCDATSGVVRIATATTGRMLDEDGYTLLIDGNVVQPVGLEGSIDFEGVEPGSHELALDGLAENCRTNGDNPRAIDVVAGDTVSVIFSVECVLRGRIAFRSGRDGNREIYVMNADGTDPIRLTNNNFIDQTPSWSPDGTRIVFHAFRELADEIYVMNSDGTAQENITTTPDPAVNIEPQWSPDGTKVVFMSSRSGDPEIYAMNPDGTGVVQLTDHPGLDDQPAWSPDGTKIVFMSARSGNNDIWIMNADGSSPIQVTTHLSIDYMPDWSPQGDRIAFTTEREGNLEVYTIGIDGSDPINISNAPSAIDTRPEWSPDGDYVAFESTRAGDHAIYVVDADGSSPVSLSVHPAGDREPSWLP